MAIAFDAEVEVGKMEDFQFTFCPRSKLIENYLPLTLILSLKGRGD
jgi:hypothetical protein